MFPGTPGSWDLQLLGPLAMLPSDSIARSWGHLQAWGPSSPQTDHPALGPPGTACHLPGRGTLLAASCGVHMGVRQRLVRLCVTVTGGEDHSVCSRCTPAPSVLPPHLSVALTPPVHTGAHVPAWC